MKNVSVPEFSFDSIVDLEVLCNGTSEMHIISEGDRRSSTNGQTKEGLEYWDVPCPFCDNKGFNDSNNYFWASRFYEDGKTSHTQHWVKKGEK